MTAHISDRIRAALTCPTCSAPLGQDGDEVVCQGCRLRYSTTPTGSLDLRLRGPKICELQFELGTPLPSGDGVDFAPLAVNPAAEVDYRGVQVPFHLSPQILSHIPKAKGPGSMMLDLGCGGAVHRGVMEHAGFEYIGLDYEGANAPLLADAHALPLRDASCEFILSIAVLEHIRYPFVMIKEAARVLKPGGKFVGTVAFLEPFHMSSFYHHTHLGTLNVLRYAGLDVHHIGPNTHWTGLRAQAMMEYFPRMPKRMIRTIIGPVDFARRTWWRARRLRNPRLDLNVHLRNMTGMFTFIATKPPHR